MSLEPSDLVEVFRSAQEKPCQERALVLRARGIPFFVVRRPGEFSLLVPPAAEERALLELLQYEEENRVRRPKVELPPAAYGYGRAVAAYIGLIVLLFALEHVRALGGGWSRAGVADAAAIRGGEVWRAMTALLLHQDLIHLLGNVLYGTLFGMLVAYVHGGGLGFLSILLAGFLGNWTNALLLGPDHRSIGASTAVFGAVGILAGAEWLRRTLVRETRMRILAPIVVGALLLGYLGMGGAYLVPDTLEIRAPDRGTDVAAHVTGLFWGVPLGALLTLAPRSFATDRRVQRAAGAAALALLGLAWILALAAGAE
ncbi:MAG: rhomboid family intramembrane serine protease [Planctomycetota bacterium]